MTWISLMKYPAEIYKLGEYIEVLNTAQELMPIEAGHSRSGTLISWISSIRTAGLINTMEHMEIQYHMIHGPGGI